MKDRLALRSWLILAILAVLAAILFSLSATLTLPGEAHTLMQSVAEALTVSIVVALVVEPRLLRHFGEELATQTFWASFYSRAPREYRQAVQELASATQFAIAVQWKVTLDWADDSRAAIRFRSEITNYRENRGQKEFTLVPRSFVYESSSPSHKATIDDYQVICEGATFHGSPLQDNSARIESDKDGRLVLKPVDESAAGYFKVPPGLRYTIIAKATTYVTEIGHAPLAIATPTLSLNIELQGTALPDLWISIIHPGLGSADARISAAGSSLGDNGPIHIGEVSLSGQAILLSWAPQRPAVVNRERAAVTPSLRGSRRGSAGTARPPA